MTEGQRWLVTDDTRRNTSVRSEQYEMGTLGAGDSGTEAGGGDNVQGQRGQQNVRRDVEETYQVTEMVDVSMDCTESESANNIKVGSYKLGQVHTSSNEKHKRVAEAHCITQKQTTMEEESSGPKKCVVAGTAVQARPEI